MHRTANSRRIAGPPPPHCADLQGAHSSCAQAGLRSLLRVILPLLTAVLAASAIAPEIRGASDPLQDRLEPWCRQLLESHLMRQTATGPQQTEAGRSEMPSSSPLFHFDPVLLAHGRLRVQLETRPYGGGAEDLRTACERQVPSLRWEGAAGHLGQATLAIEDLARLVEVPGLCYVMRPPIGLPLVIRSEGVEEIGALEYQELGYDGEPVTVGVLDIGFQGAHQLMGIELPADTKMRAFAHGNSGEPDLDGVPPTAHGTACAEIVHDVAPGAGLRLANASTMSEMEAAIRWMQDEGVSVISHSVGWFWGPGDGTGDIVDLAHQAIDSGILWVNATGNQATAYWGGTFQDANNNELHEFDEAGDETITEAHVQAGTEFLLVLTWDHWPRSPDLTFEIEVYEDGSFVTSSDQALTPEVYPYREISNYQTAKPGCTVEIVIRRTKGSESVALRLFRLDGHDLAEHRRPDGSLVLPADSPRVLSVGAYRLAGENRTLEEYSSRGPTLAGVAKPELCTLDGVTTASLPHRFCGTSAACPLAAGAAALLLASTPEAGFFDFRWNVEELRTLFEWSSLAIDLGSTNAYSWGCLHLPDPGGPGHEIRAPSILVSSPARPPIQAHLARTMPGPLRLRIFDTEGRLVCYRCLPASPGRPGPILDWDGCGLGGRPLPSGLYLLCARGPGWHARRGLLLLR